MSYIKILRLKTGEDIIAFIELKKISVKVRYPAVILIQYDPEEDQQELLMKYWLPVSLIEKNEAEIPLTEILLSLDVNEDFKEYYLNYLNNFTKITDELSTSNQEDNQDLLKRFLEAVDTKALGKAH